MRAAQTVEEGPWPISGLKVLQKKRDFDLFSEHGREQRVGGIRRDRRRQRTF